MYIWFLVYCMPSNSLCSSIFLFFSIVSFFLLDSKRYTHIHAHIIRLFCRLCLLSSQNLCMHAIRQRIKKRVKERSRERMREEEIHTQRLREREWESKGNACRYELMYRNACRHIVPHNHQHSIQLCKLDHRKFEFLNIIAEQKPKDLSVWIFTFSPSSLM